MADALSDTLDALRDITQVLGSIHCQYFLGGSFASSAQGNFRATNDLDIICDLKPKHYTSFMEKAGVLFIIDAEGFKEALAGSAGYNIIHEASFTKIDFFFVRSELHELQMQRKLSVVVPGLDTPINIASPEDIILAKLAWYQKGCQMSERQWADISGVIKVQGTRLDREYLETSARQLGLQELLNKAFSPHESFI